MQSYNSNQCPLHNIQISNIVYTTKICSMDKITVGVFYGCMTHPYDKLSIEPTTYKLFTP